MIRRTKERRRTKNSNRPHQTGKTSSASNAPPLSNPSNAALPRCRVDGGLRTRGGRSSRGGLSPSSSIHRPKARERRARRGQACSGAAGLVLLLCRRCCCSRPPLLLLAFRLAFRPLSLLRRLLLDLPPKGPISPRSFTLRSAGTSRLVSRTLTRRNSSSSSPQRALALSQACRCRRLGVRGYGSSGL